MSHIINIIITRSLARGIPGHREPAYTTFVKMESGRWELKADVAAAVNERYLDYEAWLKIQDNRRQRRRNFKAWLSEFNKTNRRHRPSLI